MFILLTVSELPHCTSYKNNKPRIKGLDKYGTMTEDLVTREIRIDEAAGRGDSDSWMTSFEVIMPLKLQSTEVLI